MQAMIKIIALLLALNSSNGINSLITALDAVIETYPLKLSGFPASEYSFKLDVNGKPIGPIVATTGDRMKVGHIFNLELPIRANVSGQYGLPSFTGRDTINNRLEGHHVGRGVANIYPQNLV